MNNSRMAPLIFLIYLAAVSIISTALTVWDKRQAKRRRWRVPERVLLLWGLFGGALPMYVTMKIIRHKTRHKAFMLGLPVEILFHSLLFCLTVWFLYR